MAKISVVTPEHTRAVQPPPGIVGGTETRAYFDAETNPVHLHLQRIARDVTLKISPIAVDRLGYVWRGTVEAGGRMLVQGSSFIVERDSTLELTGRDNSSSVMIFAAGQEDAQPRDGGHVHLLPYENVPRVGAGTSGTQGGLHANGHIPGCELWLNENTLPGWPDVPSVEETTKGIHCHPENEVIFVTEGQMRLGMKLFDAGTAIAITADTLYGFTPGPEGLSFITFRPTSTNAIRFASGGDYIHSTFWDSVSSLPYLEPLNL